MFVSEIPPDGAMSKTMTEAELRAKRAETNNARARSAEQSKRIPDDLIQGWLDESLEYNTAMGTHQLASARHK